MKRVTTTGTIKELASKIDKHHINVARAKVVGSVGKVVGGGLIVAGGSIASAIGLALTLFTAGLSLSIPAAVFATETALTVGGGVTYVHRLATNIQSYNSYIVS